MSIIGNWVDCGVYYVGWEVNMLVEKFVVAENFLIDFGGNWNHFKEV